MTGNVLRSANRDADILVFPIMPYPVFMDQAKMFRRLKWFNEYDFVAFGSQVVGMRAKRLVVILPPFDPRELTPNEFVNAKQWLRELNHILKPDGEIVWL